MLNLDVYRHHFHQDPHQSILTFWLIDSINMPTIQENYIRDAKILERKYGVKILKSEPTYARSSSSYGTSTSLPTKPSVAQSWFANNNGIYTNQTGWIGGTF